MSDPEKTRPSIVVVKPSISALWIDTSILLKIWKAKRGERLQDAENYRKLERSINEAVRARRLLCIESHQRDEFSGGRGEDELLSTMRSLSGGIRMRHWLDVWNAQLEAAMRAYLSAATQIDLGLDVFFERDPAAEISDADGFLIDVRLPEPQELIALRDGALDRTFQEWEDLRLRLRSKGVSYEEQLAREHTGYLDGCRKLLGSYLVKSAGGTASVSDWAGADPILQQIRTWTSLGGAMPQFEAFLNSQYHARLPIRRIESQLSAHLVTGNDRIRRSDSTDVYHLGLVVPVSGFVVVDVPMERRLKSLGIDREWKTEVFSVRTLEQLLARLDPLAA